MCAYVALYNLGWSKNNAKAYKDILRLQHHMTRACQRRPWPFVGKSMRNFQHRSCCKSVYSTVRSGKLCLAHCHMMDDKTIFEIFWASKYFFHMIVLYVDNYSTGIWNATVRECNSAKFHFLPSKILEEPQLLRLTVLSYFGDLPTAMALPVEFSYKVGFWFYSVLCVQRFCGCFGYQAVETEAPLAAAWWLRETWVTTCPITTNAMSMPPCI